ncbi:MAG: hypothetical protein LBF43_03440 [Puniceicoccales bacterium]|jgi:hypothetical protein|nr:hypothetical protein [Puniceicoccales bacterium]
MKVGRQVKLFFCLWLLASSQLVCAANERRDGKTDKVSSSTKMLACIKVKPLPKVLNEYVKLLETAIPQHASLVSLLLVGSMGGVECPGISNQCPVYIGLFSLDAHCTPLYFFNASEDAYLVKILQNLPQEKKDAWKLQNIPPSKIIAKDWYVFGYADLIDRMQPHWDALFQFFQEPFVNDLQIRLFNHILPMLPKISGFYGNLMKFLELSLLNDIQLIQLDMSRSADEILSIYPSIFFTEKSMYAKFLLDSQKPTTVLDLPKFYFQNDTYKVGYYNANAYQNLLKLLGETIAAWPPKELPENFQVFTEFFKSIQTLLDPFWTFSKKHLVGFFSNSTIFKNENARLYTQGTGVLLVQSMQDADLVQFLANFVNEQLNAWIKNLPGILKNSGCEPLEKFCVDLQAHVVCRFDAAVFTHKGCTVHACTIGAKTEPMQIQAQLFLTLLDQKLLYADNRSSMEQLIETYMDKNLCESFSLDASILNETKVNLNVLMANWMPHKLVSTVSNEQSRLTWKALLGAQEIQYKIDLPVKMLFKMTAALAESKPNAKDLPANGSSGSQASETKNETNGI